MSLQNKTLQIGLFGFGVVGEGLYQVLQQTPTLQAQIKKVCIKHPEKERNAPAALFCTDKNELLEDDEINVIVELIDDADAAFEIAQRALQSGKALISANKKMIAEHQNYLQLLQKSSQTPFLYEAACCASIPIIRNLEEYYDNDLLQGLQGIVNGSTNYILTQIAATGSSFEEALTLAQAKGFAERNPHLDIAGIDACNKLSILLAHAYGLIVEVPQIIYTGIQQLKPADAVYAQEKQYKIKLVAQAKKLADGQIAAFVLPQFIPKTHPFYQVDYEYNAVLIESGLADKQFFSGKGAGSFPTASAVLSDLSALRYDYKYEYKKKHQGSIATLSYDYYVRIYASFNRLIQIPHHLFEQVDEWSSSPHGCAVSGIIHCSKLLDPWWQNDYSSIILYPDPIIEANELITSSTNKTAATWKEMTTH